MTPPAATLHVTVMPVVVHIGVVATLYDVTGAPIGQRWERVGGPILRFITVSGACIARTT